MVRPTCAPPLKQVSLEGESRSKFDLTAPAQLNMNKLLLICLLGAALMALSGGNNFIIIQPSNNSINKFIIFQTFSNGVKDLQLSLKFKPLSLLIFSHRI